MCRYLIVAVFLLLGSVGTASATELFFEGFDYNVGDNLNNQTNAASGNQWLRPGVPSGTVQVISAGDVNYPGMPTVENTDSLFVPRPSVSNQSENRINIPGRPYTRSSGASLFFSFTAQMTDWSFFAPNGSDTNNDAGAKNPTNRKGGFLGGFHGGPASTSTNMQSANGFAAPIYVRREIDFEQTGTDGAPGAQTFRYEFGIGKSASALLEPLPSDSEQAYNTSLSFGVGDIVLIVGQYDFVDAGAGGSADIAQLWINPTPGDVAAESSPFWVAPAITNYPNLGGTLSLESFHVRADTNSPGNFKIDNIRVGTTFADVIPAAPSTGGDFNDDGFVDAADYVAWRKNAPGDYTEDDYLDWVTNFGTDLGEGGGSGSVPEPSTFVGILLLATAISAGRSRR